VNLVGSRYPQTPAPLNNLFDVGFTHSLSLSFLVTSTLQFTFLGQLSEMHQSPYRQVYNEYCQSSVCYIGQYGQIKSSNHVTKWISRAPARSAPSVGPKRKRVERRAFHNDNDTDVDFAFVVHDASTGPKVWPSASVMKGTPFESAVFCQTVLPHQLRVTPPRGNWRQKKIRMTPIATPESSAAERR